MFDSGNRLFVMARRGRHTPAALAIAVAFVTIVVGLIGGQILLRSLWSSASTDAASAELVTAGFARMAGDAAVFLPMFACLWMWLAFWSHRPFSSLGFEQPRWLIRLARGGLLAFLMMAAVAVVIAFLPLTTREPGTLQASGLAAGAAGMVTLAGTAIQSSAEEAIFRGWLLPSIGSRHGVWPGVIVSSALFGAAHSLNPHATPVGVMNLALFGGFLALLALRDGALWGACAWHTVWNWTNSDLFGLSGSGAPPAPALLVWLKPYGPDTLTGGRFGPDGGLIESAVLVTGIVLMVLHMSHCAGTHDAAAVE